MSKQYNGNKETICCLDCGRDTKSVSGYCARCLRFSHNVLNHLGGTGRNHADEQMPLHDDYSEDSSPFTAMEDEGKRSD